MKKTTLFLLAIGTLCMGFTFLAGHFFKTSLDIGDFLIPNK